MISFTFSVEQVKSAPPEVRQWIEQQVAAALVAATTAHSEPPQGHAAELASCTIEEAAVVLELIRDDIATTHVFLELARETPAGNNVPPLRALNIADILRHTRLNGDRLVDCLSVITQTFQQIHGAPEAALFGLDQSHLYLHEGTHRSIRGLWQQLVQMQAPSRTTATAPTTSARAPLTGSAPPPGAAADPQIPTSRQAPPLDPAVAETSVSASDRALEKEPPTRDSTASAQPTPAASPASGRPEINESASTRPAPTRSTPSAREETPPAQPAAAGPGGPDRRRQAGHRAGAPRIPGPTAPSARPGQRAAGASASNKRKPH